MVALVSTASTPTNVFVVMDGKERIVKQVSLTILQHPERALGNTGGRNGWYCL